MGTQSKNTKYFTQVIKKEWHLDWKSITRITAEKTCRLSEQAEEDLTINIIFKNIQNYKREQHILHIRKNYFRKYKLEILAMKTYDYWSIIEVNTKVGLHSWMCTFENKLVNWKDKAKEFSTDVK